MKRTSLIFAAALGSVVATSAFAGEENLFAPPKPMPDNFSILIERTVEEQEFNRFGDGQNNERSRVLETPRTAANNAEVHQNGTNHRAGLRQTGTNNSFVIFQAGNGAVANVEQSGHGKMGWLLQFSR